VTAPAIEFKGVNKWFGKLHVLRDVTLRIQPAEVVVVCGPSGSGKSTLIRCVNRLEPIQQGEVTVLGQSLTQAAVSLSRLRSEVGMVFQSFNLYPHKTALENIVLAPIKVKGLGRPEAALVTRFIILYMDASLAYIIGVRELTRVARIIAEREFRAFEVFTFIALVYFACTYLMSLAARRLERRLATA
jgi:ABC-type sugar transport system ATPase subunit